VNNLLGSAKLKVTTWAIFLSGTWMLFADNMNMGDTYCSNVNVDSEHAMASVQLCQGRGGDFGQFKLWPVACNKQNIHGALHQPAGVWQLQQIPLWKLFHTNIMYRNQYNHVLTS
jgi:hypothetical protein